MRTANNDTKLHGAITTRDLARLRDGLKVGQKVPCIIEIPCEGRGERERFFEEVVRRLPIKRKYPYIVALSGMGIYRDTTISYAELALLLRAEGKRI